MSDFFREIGRQFLFVDEKQIVQESLEIENMNLTDQLLQATGQMEVLAAQRDSLQAEKGQLVQNCEQARHDYNTLTAHNSTLGTKPVFDPT